MSDASQDFPASVGSDAPPGDVAVFFDGDRTLILLQGHIDLSVAEDLEDAGRDAIDAGRPIVADVRRVDTIDSIGVSFLIRLAGTATNHGSSVALLGPAPRVSELLSLLEAHHLFTWEEEP